jgi:hypothetical protein
MLIGAQKTVKEDGEGSPEFADAEEGDLQFALLWSFFGQCKDAISLIQLHLQKSYMNF